MLAAGKFLGTISGTWEQASALYDRGYQLVTLMADGTSLAKLARATVAEFQAEYPEG